MNTTRFPEPIPAHELHTDCLVVGGGPMSPAGGVGINLAIQDAVATANLIGPILAAGRTPTTRELRAVQRRRAFPAAITQRVQRVLQRFLANTDPERPLPWLLQVAPRVPGVGHLVGRFVGMGVRPEHVRFGRCAR
ncbi:hypothetical protein [uncultured Microbacterium sp.]|uniref:hypothetical protein n=1 Tax=uncultured Microbacterium sp. TaxID=191216 RepID=UPI0025DBCA5C|nr:hypothetical protein [uncultured Microbacterium sp.]